MSILVENWLLLRIRCGTKCPIHFSRVIRPVRQKRRQKVFSRGASRLCSWAWHWKIWQNATD